MENIKGKVVWITGASSGIGEALAYAFSKEGALLVLSARRISELERVKSGCKDPDKIMILELDVEKQDIFPGKVQAVLAEFGRIDFLINNSGISQRSNAFDTKEEVERKIMEVNFFGNVLLSKAVLPVFRKQGSGWIIVMSSIAGKFGFYLRSAYSASKHALHGYYESMRMEEEKYGLKILMVCPGKIKTPISVNAMTSEGKKHGIMDHNQLQGMPADECASQILNAIKKNKEEVLIGKGEIRAVFFKRFFPKLFSRMIRKQPAA